MTTSHSSYGMLQVPSYSFVQKVSWWEGYNLVSKPETSHMTWYHETTVPREFAAGRYACPDLQVSLAAALALSLTAVDEPLALATSARGILCCGRPACYARMVVCGCLLA